MNEDWDLFLRLALRGMRWACIDEALCEYRVHGGQSHRRVQLVYDTRLRILERAFADPALPADLRARRRDAFHEAHLVGAAELFAAGQTAEAEAAFLAAVRVRPESLGDAAHDAPLRAPAAADRARSTRRSLRGAGATSRARCGGAVEATLATPGARARNRASAMGGARARCCGPARACCASGSAL